MYKKAALHADYSKNKNEKLARVVLCLGFTANKLHFVPSSRNKMIMEAEAEAEAIALKGDAEAYAIECRAKAEAEQMAKKADAWKEYKEAAMIDMMIQTLPKV
jgi:hypothetical protein